MIGLNGHTGLTTGGQGAEWAGYQAKELYDGYSRPTSMSDVFSFGGLILTVSLSFDLVMQWLRKAQP